jgi:hypothetical protein
MPRDPLAWQPLLRHWTRRHALALRGLEALPAPEQLVPDHAIDKRLQLLRQLGGAEVEVPVRHHDDDGQVQHLGVELKKAKSLGAQAVLEPRLGVHLHLQQHHRLLGCSALTAAWPEDAIKTVIHRF